MYEDAVLIALGSNLKGGFGSSETLLEAALDNFPAAGFKVVARSPLWRSASWPDPALPDYINALAIVETALSPTETLLALHQLEASFGRRRERPNAPRTLDLDLVAHGRSIMASAGLILPHPDAARRLFVMGPLAQIAPDWVHPVLGQTARALAAKADIGRDARPIPASAL
jgi:2-amino-4-hydroxy-6-hydroxymethyldihydropteridine diphosphokinase